MKLTIVVKASIVVSLKSTVSSVLLSDLKNCYIAEDRAHSSEQKFIGVYLGSLFRLFHHKIAPHLKVTSRDTSDHGCKN